MGARISPTVVAAEVVSQAAMKEEVLEALIQAGTGAKEAVE